MKLKSKFLIFFVTIIIIYILLFIIIEKIVIKPIIQNIETTQAIKDSGRCVGSLKDTISQLAEFTFDWGAWDDTYQFISDLNSDYINANLLSTTFKNNSLQIIFYAGLDRNLKWGGYYSDDKILGKNNRITQKVFQTLKDKYSSIFSDKSDLKPKSGIVFIKDLGTLLICASPILTSEDDGPCKGTLFMGRLINNKTIAEIKKKILVDYSLTSLSTEKNENNQKIYEELLQNNNRFLKIKTAKILHLYSLVGDYNEEPVLLLEVILPRETFQHASEILNFSLYSMIIIGIVLIVGTAVLLQILILSRVSRTVSTINNYKSKGILPEKKLYRNDEIGILKNELYNMLFVNKKNRIYLEELIEKLKISTKAAESANLAKSNFLANMSHEIRTPMNAVIGFTNLLKKTKLNDYQKNYLSKIYISAENLTHIINEILDFSKIEAGKMNIESIRFDLMGVLSNISNIISHKAEEKNLKFSLNVNSSVPLNFVGDSLRIGQILLNLTSNAVKFTNNGEIRVDIQLISKSNDIAIVKFSVKDSGIGLRPEELDTLFEAFTQADASTTRNFGGTGLGLCISKNLANMLDGDIEVESIYGQGSTFSLCLPLNIYTGESKHTDISIMEVNEKKAFSKEKFDLIKGAHILLVEDNIINQQLAYTILNDENFIVTVASNGEEALKLIEFRNFDIVLMDLQMPVMGGIEATQKIRTQKRFKNLPVIAMTADVMEEAKNEALQAGLNDYISKPIDVNELFNLLIKWIKPKRHKELSPQFNEQSKAKIDIEFAALQSIDTSIGLKCCAGKKTLYKKMLFGFRKEYEDYEEIITNALYDEKIEFLQRYIHTLKGIAGTLGAVELFNEMSQADLELKKAAPEVVEIASILKNAVGIVNAILSDIIELEKTFPEIEPDKENSKVPKKNIKDIKITLNKLKKNLEEYDLESEDSFKILKSQIYSSENSDLLDELGSRIEKFEFENALFVLSKFIETDIVPKQI